MDSGSRKAELARRKAARQAKRATKKAQRAEESVQLGAAIERRLSTIPGLQTDSMAAAAAAVAEIPGSAPDAKGASRKAELLRRKTARQAARDKKGNGGSSNGGAQGKGPVTGADTAASAAAPEITSENVPTRLLEVQRKKIEREEARAVQRERRMSAVQGNGAAAAAAAAAAFDTELLSRQQLTGTAVGDPVAAKQLQIAQKKALREAERAEREQRRSVVRERRLSSTVGYMDASVAAAAASSVDERVDSEREHATTLIADGDDAALSDRQAELARRKALRDAARVDREQNRQNIRERRLSSAIGHSDVATAAEAAVAAVDKQLQSQQGPTDQYDPVESPAGPTQDFPVLAEGTSESEDEVQPEPETADSQSGEVEPEPEDDEAVDEGGDTFDMFAVPEPGISVTFRRPGPLGIDFDPFPLVRSIVPGSLAAQSAMVECGMVLLSIQGKRVRNLDLPRAGKLFAAAGRPVTLVFRRALPGHSVTFKNPGALGMMFDPFPLIHSVEPGTPAASVPQVQPGMALVAIQGKSVTGLDMVQAGHLFAAAGRPVTLILRPMPPRARRVPPPKQKVTRAVAWEQVKAVLQQFDAVSLTGACIEMLSVENPAPDRWLPTLRDMARHGELVPFIDMLKDEHEVEFVHREDEGQTCEDCLVEQATWNFVSVDVPRQPKWCHDCAERYFRVEVGDQRLCAQCNQLVATWGFQSKRQKVVPEYCHSCAPRCYRVDGGGAIGFRNSADADDQVDHDEIEPAMPLSTWFAVQEQSGWIMAPNDLWLPTKHMLRPVFDQSSAVCFFKSPRNKDQIPPTEMSPAEHQSVWWAVSAKKGWIETETGWLQTTHLTRPIFIGSSKQLDGPAAGAQRSDAGGASEAAQDAAAIKIQAVYRGHSLRVIDHGSVRGRALRGVGPSEEEAAASATIQAVWRGRKARATLKTQMDAMTSGEGLGFGWSDEEDEEGHDFQFTIELEDGQMLPVTWERGDSAEDVSARLFAQHEEELLAAEITEEDLTAFVQENQEDEPAEGVPPGSQLAETDVDAESGQLSLSTGKIVKGAGWRSRLTDELGQIVIQEIVADQPGVLAEDLMLKLGGKMKKKWQARHFVLTTVGLGWWACCLSRVLST
jgi:hypothetical protein